MKTKKQVVTELFEYVSLADHFTRTRIDTDSPQWVLKFIQAYRTAGEFSPHVDKVARTYLNFFLEEKQLSDCEKYDKLGHMIRAETLPRWLIEYYTLEQPKWINEALQESHKDFKEESSEGIPTLNDIILYAHLSYAYGLCKVIRELLQEETGVLEYGKIQRTLIDVGIITHHTHCTVKGVYNVFHKKWGTIRVSLIDNNTIATIHGVEHHYDHINNFMDDWENLVDKTVNL